MVKKPQQPFFPATCSPSRARATCLPQNVSGPHPPREAKPKPKAPSPAALMGSPGSSQPRAGLGDSSTKLQMIALKGRAGGTPLRSLSGLLALQCEARLVPTCEQNQQPENHLEQPELRAHISHISVPRAGKHPTFASAETAAAPTPAPVPKNGKAAAQCVAPFLLM